MRMLFAITLMVLATLPARAAELVMFEEAGCVWCQRWHAEIGPGYPHSAEGRAAPLRRVDLRAGTPSDLKLALPVTSTPTFVLVENGVERDRLVGYPGAEFFYPLLARMLERIRSRSLPAQRETGLKPCPTEPGRGAPCVALHPIGG